MYKRKTSKSHLSPFITLILGGCRKRVIIGRNFFLDREWLAFVNGLSNSKWLPSPQFYGAGIGQTEYKYWGDGEAKGVVYRWCP